MQATEKMVDTSPYKLCSCSYTKAPFKYDFFIASEPKNHKRHALYLNFTIEWFARYRIVPRVRVLH